jgi:hypothetical protein
LAPDALKQIEAKMHQMQATGTVITPEMMEAMYSAALKTGTDLNRLQSQETIIGMKEAAETARREAEAKQLKKDKMYEGIGGTLANTALHFGTKYLDKTLFPQKTPAGGSATGGGATTPGGQPIELSSNLKTVGGKDLTIGGRPTLMPGENLLTGYGSAADMQALELAPSTLPGPVTASAVTPGPLVGPTVETGGAILPSSELAAAQGAQTLATPLSPIAELGANAVAPMGVTEVGGTMIPAVETVMPVVELGTGAVAPTAEIGASALPGAAPATGMTPMSAMGPAGFGALGSGILGATGIRDDVGKVLLFGEGGKNEQDIAGGVAGGAATGAAAGTWVFPGVGTAVGGLLGGIVGGISAAIDDACIIVTCCHGRHSRQVQIAREYRDKFMTPRQIRGYYMIAGKVVPFMKKHRGVKRIITHQLVARLIRYGQAMVGTTRETPSLTDALVTASFLGICSTVGACARQYVRVNGEVY